MYLAEEFLRRAAMLREFAKDEDNEQIRETLLKLAREYEQMAQKRDKGEV